MFLLNALKCWILWWSKFNFNSFRDGLVKPISNARDTQEIPFSEAKFMFETIDSYTNTNSILEHFEFYDLRQENYEKAYL